MIYGPEDVITFGTHTGLTIKEIIEDDPSYLEWALDEVDGFELNVDAQEMLQVALDQDDPIENLFR